MRAETSVKINEILATRRSPRALQENKAISREDLLAILEAGRWAPSAFNAQPWRFYVGLRGDETFGQILDSLGDFNKQWAQRASALILVAGTNTKEDGNPHPSFQYDCGLAVAQMVVEAHDRGLVAHQMTGFDFPKAATNVGAPALLTPVVIVALGYQGDASLLSAAMAERENAPRSRKPLSEIVLKGLPH